MKVITKYVTITKKLILNGRPQSKTLCPVALAIKQQTGYDVFVGTTSIRRMSRFQWIKQTKRLCEQIKRYDTTGRMDLGKYRVTF